MIFYFKNSDKSFDNVAVRGEERIFRPLVNSLKESYASAYNWNARIKKSHHVYS